MSFIDDDKAESPPLSRLMPLRNKSKINVEDSFEEACRMSSPIRTNLNRFSVQSLHTHHKYLSENLCVSVLHESIKCSMHVCKSFELVLQ